MELWRKLVFLVRRRRFDRELDEEMRFHLEMKAGAMGDRYAAHRQFGNPTLLKEVSREMWGWNSFETLLQDMRYALRTMRRNAGFTAIVIATLALGIGANTAIFSVVDGVLLRPLPFPEQERLVGVFSHFAPANNPRGNFSVADFLDLRSQVKSLDQLAAFTRRRWTITGLERPELVAGSAVTSSFFSVLGATPMLGRTFLAGEDNPNGPRLIVLSESLWRRLFNSDPGVTGRAIVLNGNAFTVVGVMPSSFQFPQAGTDLWQLLTLAPPAYRFPFFLRGVARLKPGVSLGQAQAELNALAPGIERSDPKTYQHLSFPVLPLREGLVGNVRLPLLVMLGAVGLVLLIASVNVANLLLARAASREREMAIRMSIGAGRFRLMRQLLTESIVMALAGGVAGALLALWGVHWLRTLAVANIPRLEQARVDGRVLLFTLFICVLSGVLFGLAPALESLRSRLNESLKQHDRSGTASRSGQRTRSVLVAAEVAFSFLLLIGAGLLLRSFVKLQTVNPGFQSEDLLVAQVWPSFAKYSDAAKSNALYQAVLERMRALPGVKSVALTQGLPPNGQACCEGFRIQGHPLAAGQVNPAVSTPTVSPDYFRTLGIPLLRGRYFTEHDNASSPPVVIITDTMARHYFPDEDPVGKHLMMGWSLPNQPWREIVGIVGDVPYLGLGAEPEAAYYAPLAQLPGGPFSIVIRLSNPARLADALRASVWSIDKEMPLSNVTTMEQLMSASVAQPRFQTVLIGIFGGVALLLAAIGIYGVVAYSVTHRVHEFGIRMALGAQRGDVLGQVMRGSAVLVMTGLAAGAAGSLALTHLIRTLLYRVSPTDPVTFVGVAAILTGVALMASLIPAHRATRIDPVVALREE